MTDFPGGYPCEDCDRAFGTRRALTQHRRYVHEGANLFGHRLVEPESMKVETSEDGEGKPNSSGRDRSEQEPNLAREPLEADQSTDASLTLALLVAAVGAVLLILFSGSELGAAITQSTGPSLSPAPFSPYGPSGG